MIDKKFAEELARLEQMQYMMMARKNLMYN